MGVLCTLGADQTVLQRVSDGVNGEAILDLPRRVCYADGGSQWRSVRTDEADR